MSQVIWKLDNVQLERRRVMFILQQVSVLMVCSRGFKRLSVVTLCVLDFTETYTQTHTQKMHTTKNIPPTCTPTHVYILPINKAHRYIWCGSSLFICL